MFRPSRAPRFLAMKPLPLILGFLPLVAFSLLARLLPTHDFGIAALIAAVVAVIAIAAHRPVWPPMILTGSSLALLVILAIIGFTASTGTDRWLATWAAPAFAGIMGLIILALIPVMPFTEQFARQSTPQQYWSSPTFKQLNRVLSSAWGAAMLLIGIFRVVAAAIKDHPGGHTALELVFSAVLPVLILMYMLRFSKSYPERVSQAGNQPKDQPVA
jgi:hypothetical protein